MRTVLLKGGPADGETVDIPDDRTVCQVCEIPVIAPTIYAELPLSQPEFKTYTYIQSNDPNVFLFKQ